MRKGGQIDDSHVAARVVASNIPPFGYMVIRTSIWTETWARPRGRCLYCVLEKRMVIGANSTEDDDSALTCSIPVVIFGKKNKYGKKSKWMGGAKV